MRWVAGWVPVGEPRAKLKNKQESVWITANLLSLLWDITSEVLSFAFRPVRRRCPLIVSALIPLSSLSVSVPVPLIACQHSDVGSEVLPGGHLVVLVHFQSTIAPASVYEAFINEADLRLPRSAQAEADSARE